MLLGQQIDELLNYTEVIRRVRDNYKNVKRWTKKIDIFTKQFIIVPINAIRHWWCMIIVNPKALLNKTNECYIAYCDSMFEKRNYIGQIMRMQNIKQYRYMQLQLQQKKGIEYKLTQTNMPQYQLLLPRQTNTHDCGLYLLTYIQYLLYGNKLEDINKISKRNKLNLFPRCIIYSMRERLRCLFKDFIKLDNVNSIVEKYFSQNQGLYNSSQDSDFDLFKEKQFLKFCKINYQQQLNQEDKYSATIRFYLDTEINFYEKQKL